jgi:mRNA interferase MazF
MTYLRGDVWMVQFPDPPEGGEQGYRRPAVIVSSNGINDLPLDIVVIVPSTTTRRVNLRTGRVPDNLVEVAPSNTNGLSETSYFMCEQIRAVCKGLRMKRKLGSIAAKDLRRIEAGLCLILEMFPTG